MQSAEDQIIQSNTSKTRNSIGGISYSKTNSYDTFDDKDAKTYGWIKAEYKELIKSGDSLVAFNREGKKKFYVKIKQTKSYGTSGQGMDPRKCFTEDTTFVYLQPTMEIDLEDGYSGKPRPNSLSGYELDFPDKIERAEISNVPRNGLPLGSFESSNALSPFFYPLTPSDTIFQSMLIDGPQGKGKSNFVKLMISTINSKTNFAQIVIDREGEYTNFAKFEEMSEEGKKFFTKFGIKPVEPEVLVISGNNTFESTATMSMDAIGHTNVLKISSDLPKASGEALDHLFDIAYRRLEDKNEEITWENLRIALNYTLETSQHYTGNAGREIKNTIQRALAAPYLSLFDQKGKTPLIPENLFKENIVIVIDSSTLSPADQRRLVLYLLLLLRKYKFQGHHDEPGVLLYFDESEYLLPSRPSPSEKDQVNRIEEMIQEPVQRGRKHNYGIVTITHSIGALSKTLVDLCNTKVVFGRSVSTNVSWYRANIGKERTMELGFLEQGQCILDTRQTAVSINVKLDIPFIGKNEDYFG